MTNRGALRDGSARTARRLAACAVAVTTLGGAVACVSTPSTGAAGTAPTTAVAGSGARAGWDATCAALAPAFSTPPAVANTDAFAAARRTAPEDLGQAIDEILHVLEARQQGTAGQGEVMNATLGTGGAITAWYRSNCVDVSTGSGAPRALPRRFIDPLPSDVEVVARERGCEGGSQRRCLDEAVIRKTGVSGAALRGQLIAEYQRRGTLRPGQEAVTDGDYSFTIADLGGPSVGDLSALSRLRPDQWAGTVTIVSQAPGI